MLFKSRTLDFPVPDEPQSNVRVPSAFRRLCELFKASSANAILTGTRSLSANFRAGGVHAILSTMISAVFIMHGEYYTSRNDKKQNMEQGGRACARRL